MLATAAASRLASWINVPLPVTLASIGLAYGTFALIFDTDFLDFSFDPYDLWFVHQIALDGSSLAAIFLPPLLFEMALGVNVRRLRDDAASVAVLAVVAVLVATLIMGGAVYWVSSLSLTACLLLGAACSTTDPAAVISTFREIGAPRRLGILLEGESLLNDAAAIAIFGLLLSVAMTGEIDSVAVVLQFLWSFAVGALVGLATAGVAALTYPMLGRSSVAEVSVTVAVSYGAFLIAEGGFGASGVVAVVFAGLVTGTLGFARMGPRNWASVKVIWAQIGYWASALVLIVSAALAPGLIAALSPKQMLLTAVVYFGALLARAIVLFGALPVLRVLGLSQPIEPRQKLLAIWGGVRGAVTLVLALSVAKTAVLGDEAPIIAALAAAFALTTLGLNATTLGFVTRRLGLDRLSPTDLALREQLAAGSIERSRKVAKELAQARALDDGAIAVVLQQLDRRREEAEIGALATAEGERIPFRERLRVGLAILGGQESRLVRRAFEEGAIGPRVTLRLRRDAEDLADAGLVDGRDGYERLALSQAKGDRADRYAFLLSRWFHLELPLRTAIEMRLTSLLETDRILAELARFSSGTLPPMIGTDAAENLRALLGSRREEVERSIRSISLQYPNYSLALEMTLIARTALRKERLQQERLHADGVIGPELFAALERDLDVREKSLGAPPTLDLTLAPRALLDKAPLFEYLSGDQKDLVAKRMKTRTAAPGERILEVGDRGDAMFFIVSGAVEVQSADTTIILTNGDFFGELALFAPYKRRSTSIAAIDFSRLLVLTRKDFGKISARDPQIEMIIREAGETQLRAGFTSKGSFSKLSDSDI